MREPVGGVPPLGCDRMQREQAKVAHYAEVTGGRDSKTSSLASDPLITIAKKLESEVQPVS